MICKRRKTSKSYAVPLFIYELRHHSPDTESEILISSPFNGGHRLRLLSCIKISGSCSKASSTISIRCFSPASSSLGSGYCVLFLIYAFRLFLLSNTLTSKRVFVKTSSWIYPNLPKFCSNLKKALANCLYFCYNSKCCGVWRSLVARTAGGREVAGSNPVAPINAVKSRVCGLSVLMKNRKVIKKVIKSKKGNHFL